METESIEEILKGIGCEDAPADVRKIAEQTFENFTTTLTQPRQHVLRRVGARSTMIRFAAAAIIIAAVIVGVQNFFRPELALADVAANMKSRPWMHTISVGNDAGKPVGEEIWASFGSKILIQKKQNGAVNYVNHANNQQKVYDPHDNVINVAGFTGPEFPVPTNSAVELIDHMVEKDKEKLVTYKTEGDLAVYEFDGTDKQCIDNVRLTVDLRTKLPVAAVRKTNVIATGRTTEAMINYEFPERGPQDIYAVGVPADAKLIYGRIEPDIRLADELEQVNEMYAAADIDGLVAILAEARYHQSKVQAANYLAEIGDLRAIAPLQKLSEESNDPGNPFGKAAARIKSRLEKMSLKTAPGDDNDMEVVSLVPTEVNVVPPPVNVAASDSVYDHFLFTRRDQTDGGESINTPVVARITAKGFEFRNIDMKGKSAHRWGEGLLCVVAGTMYAKNGEGELSAVNLSTGQTELLASDDDDSVYSLLNFYGGHSYVYDDGRLYGQAGKDDDSMTLRVLDFRTRAYRDIATLEHELEYTSLTLSPDHKQLAYFAQDPNGNLLTVVDVASGQVMHPSEPVKFVIPVISSRSWYAPPLAWVDTNRVVCIRTEVGSGNMNDAVNKVAVIDVTTGQMEDIVPLPENPYIRFVSMTQKYKLAGPRIRVGNLGQFSIDLAERKLIEDDSVNGDYLVSDGYLFYGEQELGGPGKHGGLEALEVSPDGKRAIWISDGKLYYHDSASEAAVPVLQEGSASGGLHWFRAEDLKAPAVAPGVPPGWIAFKDRPPRVKDADDDKEDRLRRWRERKGIRDHLLFAAQTDTDTYLLHEPVQITLTLTSISNADIEVAVPSIFGRDFSPRTISASLEYPRGSTTIDHGAQPYEPNVQMVVLRPGESVSATGPLEVALVGDYRIRYEYKGFAGEWRGDLEAEVPFTVNPVGSPEQEQSLFDAKFDRLMAKFHRELSIAPSWNGANNTVGDEIIGIPGMGPKVVPYLVEVIKNEHSDVARELLYRPLVAVAGPETLPFFQDRLLQGEAEPTCGWLYNIYKKRQEASQEALAALLSAMNHADAGVRREVAKHVARIYDPNIEACFKAALKDQDEQVRVRASRYLAAAEWLDLDQWLDAAFQQPTRARCLAAKSIVEQLEKAWNISKGALPDVSWEQLKADPAALEQFRTVLGAWRQWAGENLRFSSQFFDRDREHWLKEASLGNE